MSLNYYVYFAIVISITINILFWIKRPKATDDSNDRLLSPIIKIVNYGILANIISSVIAVILKLNQVLDFDQYLIAMYISFILIVLSSLFGMGEIINRMIQIKLHTPELLKEVSPRARMRFFLQFAMFVFGGVWALTDSLLSFTWLDCFSKLISFEPLQHTPVVGIFYIVSIYLVSIFKVSELIQFNKIRMNRINIPKL